MSEISEKTKVSLGFILTLVAVVSPIVIWLVAMSSDQKAMGKTVDRHEDDNKQFRTDLTEIKANTAATNRGVEELKERVDRLANFVRSQRLGR